MKYIKDIELFAKGLFYKLDKITINPVIHRLLFGFVIAISFTLIYIFNVLHPLFGDDWMYSVTETGHVNSFGDILREQYKHYFEWGGRSVVHVIAQSLLLAGTCVGDLLNSLAYVLFTLVIYYLAIGKWQLNVSLLIGVNMLVWFFQREFAASTLWITGSANYLWGTLIVVAFLIPFRQLIFKQGKTNDGYLKCILLFLAGIVAGWTNENTAIGLIFFLSVVLLYCKHKTGSIPKWTVAGFAGAVWGCITMLAAPGNQARSEYLRTNEGVSESLVDGFVRSLFGFYNNSLSLTFIFFFLLILFYAYGKKKNRYNSKTKGKVYFITVLFFTAAIVATLAMSASPIFPDRASFGLNTFIIIAICTFYANLYLKNKLIRWLSRTTIIFALLTFGMDYYTGYKELSYADSVIQKRIATIETGKKEGKEAFVFEDNPLKAQTRFLHYWELSANPEDSPNKWLIRYYDIQSVKFIEKK
ncbi:DUF3329 domain-containing protein [Viscerimonas tarda]